MGYDSAAYIPHAVSSHEPFFAEVANFYYGDPYFPPVADQGLLSKDYCGSVLSWSNPNHTIRTSAGDPYPYQGRQNPFTALSRSGIAKCLSNAICQS